MATRSTVFPAAQTDGELVSPWTFPVYPTYQKAHEVGGWITTVNSTAFFHGAVAHGITTTGDWQVSFLAECGTNTNTEIDLFLTTADFATGYVIRLRDDINVGRVTAGAVTEILACTRSTAAYVATFIEVTYDATANTIEVFEDGVSVGSVSESTHEAVSKTTFLPVIQSSSSPTSEARIKDLFVQDYIDVKGTYPNPLAPPSIAGTNTLYSPTLTRGIVYLSPGSINSGSQAFAPAELTQSGAQTLSPPSIGPDSTVYAPALTLGTVNLAPPQIAAGSATFAPALTLGTRLLAAPVIASTAAQYGPTLVPGAIVLVMPTIPEGSATYAPALTTGTTLAPPVIGPDSVLSSPALTLGAVTLVNATIATGSLLYEPAVAPSGPQLAAPSIAGANTLYAPAVTIGTVTLALPALGPDSQLFGPTLTPGAVQLALAFIAATSTLHAPTVILGVPFVDAGTIELSVAAAEVYLTAILATLTIDATAAEITIGTS